VCIRAKEGNGEGIGEALCLLSFITTVSVTANAHCMTDSLALACLAPWTPEPSLAARANRAINGLPEYAVRHLLSEVQAGTND